jgi:hypothetical protein
MLPRTATGCTHVVSVERAHHYCTAPRKPAAACRAHLLKLQPTLGLGAGGAAGSDELLLGAGRGIQEVSQQHLHGSPCAGIERCRPRRCGRSHAYCCPTRQPPASRPPAPLLQGPPAQQQGGSCPCCGRCCQQAGWRCGAQASRRPARREVQGNDDGPGACWLLGGARSCGGTQVKRRSTRTAELPAGCAIAACAWHAQPLGRHPPPGRHHRARRCPGRRCSPGRSPQQMAAAPPQPALPANMRGAVRC